MADVSISTAQELINLSTGNDHGTSSDYLNVYLTSDIDMADNPNWAGFTGTWYMYFHGNGHTISNIAYFGTANWAFVNFLWGSVKNLKLLDMNIETTGTNASPLIMDVRGVPSSSPVIEDVRVTGKISALTNAYVIGNGGGYDQAINVAFDGIMSAKNPDISKGSIIVMGCNIRGNYICTGKPEYAMMGPCYNTSVIIKSNSARTVFGGVTRFSYLVIQGGGTTAITVGGTANGSISVLYDADVAAANGITVTGGTPVSTDVLQSGQLFDLGYPI